MDGGLRKLFRHHLPSVHWTTIESGFTEAGIPDLTGCIGGQEFWLELKAIKHWRATIAPAQAGWHLRHHMAGGRTFFVLRKKLPNDELFLVPGSQVRELMADGVKSFKAYSGGPAKWDWAAILETIGGR
jgi:hypothetical protein